MHKKHSNPKIELATMPKRKSIRLQGYDYSRAGAYFVTICAKDYKCLFGGIANRDMVLNGAGRMVGKWLVELENKFPEIRWDEYVVMPNHVHGIISIVGAPLVGARKTAGSMPKRADTRPAPTAALGDIVGAFKSITTNEYIRGVKQHGWGPFPGKLWQRNYYEHVVRSENEMYQIREYIENNPARWDMDPYGAGSTVGYTDMQ